MSSEHTRPPQAEPRLGPSGAASFKKAEIVFTPPEQFDSLSGLGDDFSGDGEVFDLSSASGWDVAIRYHDFKSRPSMQRLAQHMREISAHAIIQKAQQILGSVVHPTLTRLAPLGELPAHAESAELDLDESLENAPHLHQLGAEDLWMEYRVRRLQPVVLVVDTSLSMTGEKLALTAVALAVVLLQFPEDPIGVVAFENRATVLKQPWEQISVSELVSRFLDVPAQGYTHLEAGVSAALKMAEELEARGRGRPPATLLLTDGKYTAGRDPAYLAPRFKHLHVLKMGTERSSQALCRELAAKGGGSVREVRELAVLPAVMYGAVKDLLRGRK